MSYITLHLTSPLLTDARVHSMGGAEHEVTYVQTLLENYSTATSPGKLDGAYGLHTALAVKEAKNRLGYIRCTEAAGLKLVGYLQRPASRPAWMKALAYKRALARKRAAARTPKRVKAANLALSQVGVKEYPYGSNRVKYSLWYGVIGPWCAMFGTWCGVSVGQRSFARGSRYAYCPYVTADAVAGRNGLSVTHAPLYGDLVIYAWGGAGSNPMGDHFGRFLEWIVEGSTFRAIEGNTGPASSSDGGEVLPEERSVANVVHFVRVAE